MGAARKKVSPAKPAKPTKQATSSSPAAAVLPTLTFADARAWEAWLASNHASSRGLWLKIAKKGAAHTSVDYAQALDVALAWGWIDGQKDKLDDVWWLQRFSPRGARSIWSKINCGKAVALIEAGKMKPAGQSEVERAKKDGRWQAAYESQSKSTVPPDLAMALAASAPASAFFETLDSRNRYAVLFRVHTAKKAETRAKRIAQFVAMLARREKLHP